MWIVLIEPFYYQYAPVTIKKKQESKFSPTWTSTVNRQKSLKVIKMKRRPNKALVIAIVKQAFTLNSENSQHERWFSDFQNMMNNIKKHSKEKWRWHIFFLKTATKNLFWLWGKTISLLFDMFLETTRVLRKELSKYQLPVATFAFCSLAEKINLLAQPLCF